MSNPSAPTGVNGKAYTRPKAIVVIVVLMLAVYLSAEVGYRLYLYRKLTTDPDAYTHYSFSATEAPLYELDQENGYSYVPKTSVHFRLYGGDNKFERENILHSNNFGHLEPEDDSLEKPAGEFRIAVIGDSFSATPTSDVAWPTALEHRLNEDVELKKQVGNTSFKVINFGLDGTGFEQWPSVYQDRVRTFHPDLVIVSFIWNDILRRFMYRRTITIGNGDQVMIACGSLPAELQNESCLNADSFVLNSAMPDSGAKIVRIKRELLRAQIMKLPWLTPGPELLRRLLKGRLLGSPRLKVPGVSVPFNSTLPVFKDQDQALTASDRALHEIASHQPALLVLYHPTFEECLAKKPLPIGAEFLQREQRQTLENMLEYLPLNAGEEEIRKWYNGPYDWHPSNYGAEIYGQAVERRVAEYLRNVTINK